jgi:hypothetical protein
MATNEGKKMAETMAERIMNIDSIGVKSWTILVMSAYEEGKAAGKEEERKRWEQKQAATA